MAKPTEFYKGFVADLMEQRLQCGKNRSQVRNLLF
jgi:hypothetical protein